VDKPFIHIEREIGRGRRTELFTRLWRQKLDKKLLARLLELTKRAT
jgi:hypothetical protein